MRKFGFFCGLFSALLWQTTLAQDESQTRAELESVAAAINVIQSWLTQANARQSREEQQLQEAQLQINAVRQRQSATQSNIASTEAELDALASRQEALSAERDQRAAALGEVLRALYISREDNALKILLNQQDPSAAARLLHYGEIYSEHQLQQITAFENTLEELAAVNTALENELSELAQQRSALAEQEQALHLARQEQDTALAALQADIAGRNAELEQLEINQAELQALLEEILRAMEGITSFADIPPFAEQRGRMPLPVAASITSAFGSRYGGGNLQRQGIILGSSIGTPVRAVHAGHVVFADWLRGAGLLVIIEHGDGYMSLYGGNEALATEAGQWVDSGDIIATSGRANEASEPGLYFEIRQNGRPLDPVNWVARQAQ